MVKSKQVLRRLSHFRNRHTYEPLALNKPEICILRVLPNSEPESTLCAELVRANLDEDPVYDAISYTWGSISSLSAETIVSDKYTHFVITPNACQAVKNVRLPTAIRMLWIDPICIDQQDPAERSAQVRLMGRIYQQENCVSTSLVFDFGGKEILTRTLNCLRHQELRQAGLLRFREREAVSMEDWQRAREFLEQVHDSPYLGRLWVQQEVQLGKIHRVQIGHAEIEPWQLAPYLENFGENITHPRKQSPAILVLNTAMASKYHTLLDALAQAGRLKAKDPRDHVYDLVGMMDDPHINELTVDYSRSVAQVYANAAAYILQRHHSIDFLRHVSRAHYDKLCPKLPTWIPRWNQRSYMWPLSSDHVDRVTFVGDYSDLTSHMPVISRCRKCLHVRGARLAQIRSIDSLYNTARQHYCQKMRDLLRNGGLPEADTFAVYEAYSTASYTDNRYSKDLQKRTYSDDVSEQLESVTKGRVPQKGAANKATKTEQAVSFNMLQTEFRDQCFGNAWIVTSEGDTGIVSYPGLHPPSSADGITIRQGDEIWALQNCLAFVVLRPCGSHYEVMGPARICGSSTLNPFDVLAARGRDHTIHQLVLK